jgi:hypothetical protein
MAKKKQKIVLESKWTRPSKSSRKGYLELTTLLNQFAIVANDHFFRASSTKERDKMVALVRYYVGEFYQNFEDGDGAIDCGPLCDQNGQCVPCSFWNDLF